MRELLRLLSANPWRILALWVAGIGCLWYSRWCLRLTGPTDVDLRTPSAVLSAGLLLLAAWLTGCSAWPLWLRRGLLLGASVALLAFGLTTTDRTGEVLLYAAPILPYSQPELPSTVIFYGTVLVLAFGAGMTRKTTLQPLMSPLTPSPDPNPWWVLGKAILTIGLWVAGTYCLWYSRQCLSMSGPMNFEFRNLGAALGTGLLLLATLLTARLALPLLLLRGLLLGASAALLLLGLDTTKRSVQRLELHFADYPLDMRDNFTCPEPPATIKFYATVVAIAFGAGLTRKKPAR